MYCRDWRFDRAVASHYSKAVLLSSKLSSNYFREDQEQKVRSASADLSSGGITLCATNFSAAHKEFMKCAIKTRKLKLGSTWNAKIWWYQFQNCVTIWTSFYAIKFPFIRNFIGAKFDNTCILAFQLFVSYIFQQNSDLRNQIQIVLKRSNVFANSTFYTTALTIYDNNQRQFVSPDHWYLLTNSWETVTSLK